MKKRQLGHSGIEVPTLCFGGNVFGWTADEKRSFELLDALLESGLNFVDTADSYSHWAPGNHGGESETIIGKWFKARGKSQQGDSGDQGWVVDGRGQERDCRGATSSRRWKIRCGGCRPTTSTCTSRITTTRACPRPRRWAIYAELIAAGKVRALGASNFTAERLQSALEVSRKQNLPRYESLQPEYNLYDRAGYERALETVCATHGLGVIPYFSLASGFLSGKYHSAEEAASRPRAGMLKKYFNERGMRILEALEEVARELKAKPAQVALAWLMARPSITAPIASATTVEQLHELVEATRLDLPPAAFQKLNEASAEAVAV